MSFPLNQPAQHYRSDTSHKVFNTPVVGAEIVATADVVLISPYPGVGTWSFTVVARAVDETSVLP